MALQLTRLLVHHCRYGRSRRDTTYQTLAGTEGIAVEPGVNVDVRIQIITRVRIIDFSGIEGEPPEIAFR